MLHELVTSDELQDWIVEEVRRQPGCAGFEAEIAFVRLPTPDKKGRTWAVRSPMPVRKCNAAAVGALQSAVWQAQRAFDVIE